MSKDTILMNIVKMLSKRKFLDNKKVDANYKKLLNQKSEENIYKIKSDFNDEKCYIMFIFGKLTSMKKIHGIDAFMETSKGNKRIFIANQINQKTYKQFMENSNTEVFFDYELLVNIIEHDYQPYFEVLSEEDQKNYFKSYKTKKTEMPKMLSTDPVARYLGLKGGEIVKIIRQSITSGFVPSYRLVKKTPTSELFA